MSSRELADTWSGVEMCLSMAASFIWKAQEDLHEILGFRAGSMQHRLDYFKSALDAMAKEAEQQFENYNDLDKQEP